MFGPSQGSSWCFRCGHHLCPWSRRAAPGGSAGALCKPSCVPKDTSCLPTPSAGPLLEVQGKPDGMPGSQNKDWREAQIFPHCPVQVTEAKGSPHALVPLPLTPGQRKKHVIFGTCVLALSLPGPESGLVVTKGASGSQRCCTPAELAASRSSAL